MTSPIRHITVDSRHPDRLAQFWSEAIGYTEDPDDPNHPDHEEFLIIDPAGCGPGLLFVPVPEDKTVKNRIHLDLQPIELRDETIDRLICLGAFVIDDRRRDDGSGWVVMSDPEGNEFCVLRSSAERSPSSPSGASAPSPWRPGPDVRTADERTLLDGSLDWYREGILAKVDGLSDPQSRRRIVSSATTIAGILKHLAMVEQSWFHVRFGGGAWDEGYESIDWDSDPDWEFRTAVDDPFDALISGYRTEIARSRDVIRSAQLDDLSRGPGTPFTLRFVLVHMIEETARHLGHLDILAELTDGRVGT